MPIYSGPIIDAHHHLWDFGMRRHPWLEAAAGERGGLGDLGRLRRDYLPRDYLAAAGIESNDPHTVLAHPNLGHACSPLIDKARDHFRQARVIMGRQTRASVKAPRIMAEAYAPMLDKLQKRGFAAPRERVRIDRLHLIGAVLRYGII